MAHTNISMIEKIEILKTASPHRKNNTPIGSGIFPPYAMTTRPENPTSIYTASSKTKTTSSLPPIRTGSFSNQASTPKKSVFPRATCHSSKTALTGKANCCRG
jgi:hypothetical protein